MNNKDEADKLLSDDELDALLRGVDVPTDLQGDLRKIPQAQSEPLSKQTEQVGQQSDRKLSRWRVTTVLTLAATLLGLGLFFAWPLINGNETPIASSTENIKKPSPTDPPATAESVESAESAELVELTRNTTRQIDSVLHEIEMLELRSRLAEIEQSLAQSLDHREYQSLITAVADQSILQLGGSEQTVKEDMVQVIKNYPDTIGSKIAQEFIDSRIN